MELVAVGDTHSVSADAKFMVVFVSKKAISCDMTDRSSCSLNLSTCKQLLF